MLVGTRRPASSAATLCVARSASDGVPALDEAADGKDDEVPPPGDTDTGGDRPCPDEPVIAPAAGRLGRDPAPTDGTRVGAVTDGVDTGGVRAGGACTGTGTDTGGAWEP